MSTNPKPPVLSPGGYVHAEKTVKLYAGNLPAWSTEISMSSAAFATDEPHKTTIIGEGLARQAVAEVMIGDVDPGVYPVVLHVGGGYTNQVWLTVERTATEPITTLLTVEDNAGKMTLRIDGLTVNAGWANAKTAVIVGGDKWVALAGYNRGQTHATGTVIKNKTVEPGKTYPIDVQLKFMGGHTEVVSGTVVAPADPTPPPVKGQLPTVFHHLIDTDKLGSKETVEHTVSFGDDHAQPNARYGVSHELVVASHNGGKPDLPGDVRAALRELKPFTVARAEDHVVLIGGNPSLLHKNKNFKIKLLVTITPVETGSGGTVSAEDDTNDWGSA